MKSDVEIKKIAQECILTECKAIENLQERIDDNFVEIINLLLNTKGRLIITGIGSLRIMISAILGGLSMSYMFNYIGMNPFMEITPVQQLLMGGFLFGVVFMATDPVSGSQTNTGKIIYGFLIGLLGIMIRIFNPAYPEGMMLAILLMNIFAPLIDHYVIEANIKRRLKRLKS